MTTRPDPRPLPVPARFLAAAFAISGTVHLVRPATFASLMPGWVPAHTAVIQGSGVAELLCAAGLLLPRTRRAAGWASAALLVAVFPGNLHMAADALAGDDTTYRAVALARLPLQVPLVWIAVHAARSAPRRG